MKQSHLRPSLIMAISLLLSVIWLSPVLAADSPTFASLGEIRADGMRIPGAMDLDEAGNLYVADARGGLVHKFSPYGDLLKSFDLQASGRGLAVTPDGARLYVALDESVAIVNSDGVVVGALSGAEVDAPEFGLTGELDLDASGNVFAVDAGSMQVKVFNASGQYQNRFGGLGDLVGQFRRIGGMAINPAGQVVIADASVLNGKIQVFNVNADLSVTAAASYSKTNTATFGLPEMHVPLGLAFDAQGRGYFLDYMKSQVRVTSPTFGYLGSYTKAGFEDDQLNNVIDVVFDDITGRLFVSCDTGRIVVLGVDGGQTPVDVNHAPTAPTPQSPVAGSEVASTTPTLIINNASDEDGDDLSYHVVVKQGGAIVFQANVPSGSGNTTAVMVDKVLAENTMFSWSAQATDGELFSAESVSASFVVNATEEAPSVPVLSSPVNGESVGGEELLSWEASVDPDPNDLNVTYSVEIALDEAFTQAVADASLAETSLSLDGLAAYDDLENGLEYFWRVSALDEEQMASEQSAVGSFVYDTTSLSVTANMPDAKVSFHGNHAYAGQAIGVAPLELRDLAPGSFSVVVERAGFETFVAQVTIAEGENVDLYASLIPAVNVDKLNASRRGVNGRSGLSVSGDAVPFLVDFDNDGDLDMLVGDSSGQLTQFANLQDEGRNRISFDQGVSLGLPVMPGAVPFVADWNNDGRKDLIVGQADGAVKLFVNNGLEEAPAFGAAEDMQTGAGVLNVGSDAAPSVMDYDGDGAKDLLVGNASGQVVLFLNQGSDDAPVLAEPVVILQVSDKVVPLPVDWDADGQQELMLTAGGRVTLYRQVDGAYQASQSLGDRKVSYSGAFPVDVDGSGKQLLAGQADGKLAFLVGNGNEFVASFNVALMAKVDELGGLVADEAPEALNAVTTISTFVSVGDYASAALSADELALALPAGDAQNSALELADLCK